MTENHGVPGSIPGPATIKSGDLQVKHSGNIRVAPPSGNVSPRPFYLLMPTTPTGDGQGVPTSACTSGRRASGVRRDTSSRPGHSTPKEDTDDREHDHRHRRPTSE